MTMHELVLMPTAARVLKRMGEGSTLRRFRTFPFPHRYRLGKPKGDGEYAGDIAIDAVAELLAHKLIDAHQRDPLGDNVFYSLTELGAKVAPTGTLRYDDQNREMFSDA